MDQHNRRNRGWRAALTLFSLVTILLIAFNGVVTPVSAAPGDPGTPGHGNGNGNGNGNGKGKGKGDHGIRPGPVDIKRTPAKSPHRPDKKITGKLVNPSVVGTHAFDPIDMKVLVIAADGNESTFPAITAFLDQIGLPYMVYQVINPTTGAKTPLTAGMLWDGALHGYYQGVILTTDSLVYYDASTGSYPSAFTDTEWNILWTYESTFKIRQVTFNATGFGPETFGLNWPAWDDTQHRLTWSQTAASPVNGTLTAAGKTQLSYLKSTVTVPIEYADTVLATHGS
ncbi:MAG TPA: hypothetical protein VFT66_03050, partial [Roseiflexaceae bacterium]|nr:hypothetical protein [Roseiflexaceae bacterium]